MKNILDKIKNRKAVISAVSLVLFVGIVFWAVNSPAVVGASASDRQKEFARHVRRSVPCALHRHSIK